MRLGIGLLLLWASLARGAVIDASLNTQGMLVTAQTAAGVSANSLKIGLTKFRSVVFTMWNTAGTATPQIEINCTGQPIGWALVANSATALAVETRAVDIVYPGCEYRVNVPAGLCTGCSLNVQYYCLPPIP